MATLKAMVYRAQRKADGTTNVKIRVIHKRQVRNIATSHYVTDAQLTRGGKIKDARLQDILEQTLREMRQAIDALGWSIESMTCAQVCDYLRERQGLGEWSLPFVEFARREIATMKAGTGKTYLSAVNSWESVIGECDIRSITKAVVLRWLDATGSLKESTRYTYYTRLLSVHNRAKERYNDEVQGVLRIANSPFAGVPVKPAVVIANRALDRAVVQRIISLEREQRINSRRNLARDLFLLSFALMGMNLADLWEARETDGYVEYRRKKTRDRTRVDNLLVVKIEPEIRPIIARYAKDGYLLGRLRERHQFVTLLGIVAKSTRQLAAAVGAEFTHYAARHTWATIARNDVGADKWTVHEALAHSDTATSIDDVYIKKDYSRLWSLNRSVLDLFNWAEGNDAE